MAFFVRDKETIHEDDEENHHRKWREIPRNRSGPQDGEAHAEVDRIPGEPIGPFDQQVMRSFERSDAGPVAIKLLRGPQTKQDPGQDQWGTEPVPWTREHANHWEQPVERRDHDKCEKKIRGREEGWSGAQGLRQTGMRGAGLARYGASVCRSARAPLPWPDSGHARIRDA